MSKEVLLMDIHLSDLQQQSDRSNLAVNETTGLLVKHVLNIQILDTTAQRYRPLTVVPNPLPGDGSD